jgi:hypothetical protein
MLGRTLHAYGSAFRMLPNPTVFGWDKKSFSMWRLLRAYRKLILSAEKVHQSVQVSAIQKRLEEIIDARNNRTESDFTIPVLDALHEALDVCDSYLTDRYMNNDQILYVLRGHIQEVLAEMNGSEDDENVFDALSLDAPEHKQSSFMQIYFDTIRPRVVSAALQRRSTTFPQASPRSLVSDSTQTDGSPTSATTEQAQSAPVPGLVHTQTGFDEDEKRYNDIWCTLVFRMLCWLLLHDFHKKDVQKPKSELLGSRLPVFIV